MMLGSSVGSLPAQSQMIFNSLAVSPIPESNSVPGNVTLPPQSVKSELSQVQPQVQPQVPIESPKVNPKVAPVIAPAIVNPRIDPRVEQQVPARSPDRDLLRVVPSQPGTSSDNELGVLRQRQGTPMVPSKNPPSNAEESKSNSQDANDDLGTIDRKSTRLNSSHVD